MSNQRLEREQARRILLTPTNRAQLGSQMTCLIELTHRNFQSATPLEILQSPAQLAHQTEGRSIDRLNQTCLKSPGHLIAHLEAGLHIWLTAPSSFIDVPSASP